MKPFLLICAMLLAIGCTKTMLTKDNFTQSQFDSDLFDCQQKVITMYGGYANMGIGHAIIARGDMFTCMRTKGYHEATQEGH